MRALVTSCAALAGCAAQPKDVASAAALAGVDGVVRDASVVSTACN